MNFSRNDSQRQAPGSPGNVREHMHRNKRQPVWFVTDQTASPRCPSFRDASLRHASDDAATTPTTLTAVVYSRDTEQASDLASFNEGRLLGNVANETENLTAHS